MFLKNHLGKSAKYQKIVEVTGKLMSEKGYNEAKYINGANVMVTGGLDLFVI